MVDDAGQEVVHIFLRLVVQDSIMWALALTANLNDVMDGAVEEAGLALFALQLDEQKRIDSQLFRLELPSSFPFPFLNEVVPLGRDKVAVRIVDSGYRVGDDESFAILEGTGSDLFFIDAEDRDRPRIMKMFRERDQDTIVRVGAVGAQREGGGRVLLPSARGLVPYTSSVSGDLVGGPAGPPP